MKLLIVPRRAFRPVRAASHGGSGWPFTADRRNVVGLQRTTLLFEDAGVRRAGGALGTVGRLATCRTPPAPSVPVR